MSSWFRFGRKAADQEDQRDGHDPAEVDARPNTEKAVDVGKAWGIDEELWDRTWGDLSGGEAQRIALAAAVGLGQAEILLLDGMCRPPAGFRHAYAHLRADFRAGRCCVRTSREVSAG